MIPPDNFCGTLAANVNNDDAAFREFVRNTLPKVDYKLPAPLLSVLRRKEAN